jgi:hypothetical protein
MKPSSLIAVLVVFSLLRGGFGQVPTSTGKWEFREVQDTMDNITRVMLSLNAETQVDGKTPTLVIRCQEHNKEKRIYHPNVDLYVITNTPVHGASAHRLRVRFDDGKPESETWQDSEDLEAVFRVTFTDKGQIRFLQRMAAARAMLFEFTPYLGVRQVMTFDVTGLGPHLERAAQLCAWPK